MMSKPATHRVTAAASTSGAGASSPVSAIQAPIGASPSATPSQRWAAAVTRLAHE